MLSHELSLEWMNVESVQQGGAASKGGERLTPSRLHTHHRYLQPYLFMTSLVRSGSTVAFPEPSLATEHTAATAAPCLPPCAM